MCQVCTRPGQVFSVSKYSVCHIRVSAVNITLLLWYLHIAAGCPAACIDIIMCQLHANIRAGVCSAEVPKALYHTSEYQNLASCHTVAYV